MNLQSYIADLVTVMNNIVIPFILGIAFLVFVINVFRFFILGGSNPDSQEKAKRLAVYGVGAFVFIIIFWGIVNLLTSSFALQLLGERESRCSDYECPDGNNPTGNNSVGFSGSPSQPSTGLDPRPATIDGEGPSFPSSPSMNTPSEESLPAGLTPDTLPSNQPPLRPDAPSELSTIPGTTNADYRPAVRTALTEVSNIMRNVEDTFLTDQVNLIGSTGVTDESRLQTAAGLAQSGLISNETYQEVFSNVNEIRQANNQQPITQEEIEPSSLYSAALSIYRDEALEVENILYNWYGSDVTADIELDQLLNSAEYSLTERQDSLADIVSNIERNSPRDPAVVTELENSFNTLISIESQVRELQGQ